MFWPSAKYESFGGFCGSLFIVGGGLSTLETSADPYLSICGPPRLSDFRLEAAQGVQAIGSVIAPLIAARAFYKVDGHDLVSHPACNRIFDNLLTRLSQTCNGLISLSAPLGS